MTPDLRPQASRTRRGYASVVFRPLVCGVLLQQLPEPRQTASLAPKDKTEIQDGGWDLRV